jgi:hypothetical protein
MLNLRPMIMLYFCNGNKLIFIIDLPNFKIINQLCSDSVYLVEPTSGWVFEDGTEFDREHAPDFYHAPVIENKELDTLWYSQYFASQGTIILCHFMLIRTKLN